MKQKRPARRANGYPTCNWTPRTSYVFLAKRRYPAELDDVTLARHGRLERELERTKKTIDSIKAKAIQDIDAQRKALRKTIHGKDDENDVEKAGTETETNELFKNIQDENARAIHTKNGNSVNLKKDTSLYLSKERFQRLREDIAERLSPSDSALNTDKFKILLRRPSSADLLRKAKKLEPLRRIREVASPRSDSCVIMASKRT